MFCLFFAFSFLLHGNVNASIFEELIKNDLVWNVQMIGQMNHKICQFVENYWPNVEESQLLEITNSIKHICKENNFEKKNKLENDLQKNLKNLLESEKAKNQRKIIFRELDEIALDLEKEYPNSRLKQRISPDLKMALDGERKLVGEIGTKRKEKILEIDEFLEELKSGKNKIGINMGMAFKMVEKIMVKFLDGENNMASKILEEKIHALPSEGANQRFGRQKRQYSQLTVVLGMFFMCYFIGIPLLVAFAKLANLAPVLIPMAAILLIFLGFAGRH